MYMLETGLTSDSAPPAWRRHLLYATVAVMPLSVNVQALLHKKSKLYASPFDVLLPVLAILLAADLVRSKPWARFRIPPVPSLIWAGLALVSCLWVDGFPSAAALKSWGNGALNPVFFGVVAVWVFLNAANSTKELRRLALILGVSMSVCLLIALVQYFGPVGRPFDPQKPWRVLGGVSNVRLGGWYDYRGILGASLAMIVPAAAAFAALEKDLRVRTAAVLIVLSGLTVTLHAGGFAGACMGILAIATAMAVHRRWREGLLVTAVLLGLIMIVLPRLPRDNAAVLQRGFALFADADTGKKPTAGLRRHQAALDLMFAPSDPYDEHSAPLWHKGAGAGQFQNNINKFYQPPYSKPGRRTDDEAEFDMEADEPFTFGFLETVAVELGLPGLLAVLFLFGSWIASAHGAFARLCETAERHDAARVLALAAFGAGCGALVVSFFGNPAIRGVGSIFAFFYAISFVCASLVPRRPAC
jgi:hypothetical protein